jgi:hypothetical protein
MHILSTLQKNYLFDLESSEKIGRTYPGLLYFAKIRQKNIPIYHPVTHEGYFPTVGFSSANQSGLRKQALAISRS